MLCRNGKGTWRVLVAAHPSTADFETYEDESLDRFSPR